MVGHHGTTLVYEVDLHSDGVTISITISSELQSFTDGKPNQTVYSELYSRIVPEQLGNPRGFHRVAHTDHLAQVDDEPGIAVIIGLELINEGRTEQWSREIAEDIEHSLFNHLFGISAGKNQQLPIIDDPSNFGIPLNLELFAILTDGILRIVITGVTQEDYSKVTEGIGPTDSIVYSYSLVGKGGITYKRSLPDATPFHRTMVVRSQVLLARDIERILEKACVPRDQILAVTEQIKTAALQKFIM